MVSEGQLAKREILCRMKLVTVHGCRRAVPPYRCSIVSGGGAMRTGDCEKMWEQKGQSEDLGWSWAVLLKMVLKRWLVGRAL